MTYSAIGAKQQRLIKNDLQLLFSPRAFSQASIEEWKRLGIHSLAREIKVKSGGSILLSDEGYSAIRQISDLILELPSFADSVSMGDALTTVKAAYNGWFLKGLVPDGQEFMDPILQELAAKVKDYEHLIKVEGIDLKDQNLIELGSIRIQRSDETVLKGVQFNALDPARIEKTFESSIWLIGKTRGTKAVAQERFEMQVLMTVGVLAVCAAVLFQDAFRRSRVHPLISIGGPADAITLLMWEQGGGSPSISRKWGREQDLPLDAASVEHLNKECFLKELASLPDRDQRTELQDAIVRSLYWIADAHSDRNPPMMFVKLWSSLECFFSIGREGITESNARGIASILAFGGSGIVAPGDYDAIKRRVKELYKLRSKAVHSAKFDHIETTDVDELARWVGWVIITMVSLSEHGYRTLRQVNEQTVRLDQKSKPPASRIRRWIEALLKYLPKRST